jgi:hypothetical protein
VRPRSPDTGAQRRGRPRRALALAGLLLIAGCRCPDPVERWDTPHAALATWQARLCRDDPEGEYACLARSFQAGIGGYQSYYEARSALLEREPLAAWLFRRADLDKHVVSASFDPDGRHAALVLQAGEAHFTVGFEREAFVTVTWDDGRTQTARQHAAPTELLVVDERTRRQWLALEKPEIADPVHVRELSFSARWMISDLAGMRLARDDRKTPEAVP